MNYSVASCWSIGYKSRSKLRGLSQHKRTGAPVNENRKPYDYNQVRTKGQAEVASNPAICSASFPLGSNDIHTEKERYYRVLLKVYLFFYLCILLLYITLFILVKTYKKSIAFSYIQIVWDVVFVTAIIYLTGGSRSIFSFLYILSIINASIILFRYGSFIIASISSALYTTLLLLENYNVIKYITTIMPNYISLFPTRSSDIFFNIFINIAAFFIVAYLSSYLAEQLRRTGEELKGFQLNYEELEAINKNIVQSISSGLITINKDSQITFLNQAAEELTGYSLAKAFNTNINEIFKGINLVSSSKLRGVNRFEFKYTKNRGKELYLGFSLSSLKDIKGNDLGKILIFQDLTKFKEMEEQLKMTDKLAAIGKMAAGIAHEIRNPMASISASIQMLQQEVALDRDNQKLMDIILRESDRLNSLITDFLLFAKPSKLIKEAVPLNLVIDETIQLLRHSPMYSSDIKIIREFNDDLLIIADPKQLRQVFFNLFINSFEAMPNGGELRLTTRRGIMRGNKMKDHVEIVVKDTGAGIPDKIIDQIYDPFFTTKEHGTGLGLAIVYRIIEHHDGHIFLNMKVSEGTEFHLLFPV